jgi:23S rRNA (adenine2030-N6)-methyltransferase
MLSYRHAYHAGNFADLLKHLVLVQIVKYMTQKATPLRIIDTHAGAGCYSLLSIEAQKNREYEQGIATIWNQTSCPSAINDYVNTIRSFNRDAKLQTYPGSPLLIQALTRACDRIFLHELHPADYQLLRRHLSHDRRIKIFNQDGFAGLQALVPPPDRRALVLIDPAYEIKTEYRNAVTQVTQAYKRFATGTYVIWYPVVSRQRIDEMEKALKKTAIRNILLVELGLAPDTDTAGMTASGLFIINPPWTLWQTLEDTMSWLVTQFAPNTGHYRLEQLVGD